MPAADRKGEALLRRIPKVDAVLSHPKIASLLPLLPRAWVVESVQRTIEEIRSEIRAGRPAKVSADGVAEVAAAFLQRTPRWSLRAVVNATGVVVHTNLGRSPLSPQAVDRIREVAAGYCNLEYDLAGGGRGERSAHVEGLLLRLTGAQAALVVNNNAAAVVLSLAALAAGREVIVSRGELVEIGGSFRMPEVMAASGAIMREVGTTNRTRLSDYRRAVTPQTALLLRVHTSNYRVVGFTGSVAAPELVALGRELAIPVMDDVGSGCLVLPRGVSPEEEPTIRSVVASGIDLLTFSGDKLLGGPQAGIILGRRDLVEKIRAHPLHRAVRIDKLTLAALEGTLWHYLEGPDPVVPTPAMIGANKEALGSRCSRLARRLAARSKGMIRVTTRDEASAVGGGALPLHSLPTVVIALQPSRGSLESLEAIFRRAPVPVIGRIGDGAFLLDLRCVSAAEEPSIVRAFTEAVAAVAGGE